MFPPVAAGISLIVIEVEVEADAPPEFLPVKLIV
jgi:hypothetical protein